MRSRRVRSLARPLSHYLFIVLIVAVTTGLLFILREDLSRTTVALLYLLPVLISTTLWGLGPGIIAAGLSFFAYNYFFLLPYYTLVVHESQDIVALAIFLVVAIFINQLVGQAKKNLAESMARERELTYLYELSLALTRENTGADIATVIASQALELFHAKAVTVNVHSLSGAEEVHIHLPPAGGPPESESPLAIPLETARGVLGEILVWREDPAGDPSKERLVRTFAYQGALALERAALVESETRAKVLEESDRLKSALLSSVSHELRTPLATIKAAITSLLNDQVGWETQARRDLLSAVDEESDLLNRLVGNLLDMSRIEAGVLKPNRQWNVLSEIVDGVVERSYRMLSEHQVSVEIPEDLTLVPVDFVQMEQVFSNLLSNSAKYAPPGSTIQVRASKIAPDSLLVMVTNEGPQIAREHLERIFDKFSRLTDAERVSGTGLGLSICKGIIEAHGGKLWAENLPTGIAFKFTLPLLMDGIQPPVIEAESLS